MENSKRKAQGFKRTLLANTMAIAFGSAIVASVAPITVFAQSNASGTLYGKAKAGSTVVVTSKDTGARRTVTVDSSGAFNVQSLVTGSYKIELLDQGNVVRTESAEVRVGQGTEVSLETASLQAVQVTGARQTIDVTSVGSTTVFTASDLARVPVAANVGAVIQLAPNTTRGDSRYGGSNAPSFGGSSASENAYYINGFPVTTLLTQVGFAQLPFQSIAQAQVLTGGYGAEFGRSTGGVVNIVTKSGGNSWAAGVSYSIEPNSLRSKERDIYYANNGLSLDGKILFRQEDNTRDETVTSGYVSGPLIEDKLFLFFNGEHTRTQRNIVRQSNTTVAGTNRTAGWQERVTEIPRYLLKLDWNVTDSHHLEYTRMSDEVRDNRSFSGFNYATLSRNGVPNGGQYYQNWGPTPAAAQQGAIVDILKYTGYFTEDLTFTAVFGKTNTPHSQIPSGYDPTLAQTGSNQATQAPGLVYNNPQGITGTILADGSFDENKGARFDIEYKLNAQHSLRAGLDRNTIRSATAQATAGGRTWTYQKSTTPSTPLVPSDAPINSVVGNPLAQQGFYVQETISITGSTPTVEQSAWYIEDKWKVTDRVLLSLGLRNEAFDNQNGDGVSYIKLDQQLAPRIGVSWDINGDASSKVFGFFGRYHVPLPTNVAVRGAGASLNTTRNYVYTGVDPATGAPTGTTALGPVTSGNNEFGQSKDPRTVAAEGIQGNFQDELAIGFERAVSKELSVGGKFTYRTLRTAIDDFCDARPFNAWAARNNKTVSKKFSPDGFQTQCYLFNPGEGNTFTVDVDGDGKLDRVELSKADLGFPSVVRTYTAVDLFAEHPFDGKWWGKATYTWSRNAGNFEGQLNSDVGQADVSTTRSFDFPEFQINGDGLLPNNRTHQVKLFGYLQATPEWGFGGNLLAASGRPKNCFGNSPTGDSPLLPGTPYNTANLTGGYRSTFFTCNGVANYRGSEGETPPDVRLDLSTVFKPQAIKGLAFKVEVFNVFNRQSEEGVEERYTASAGAPTVSSVYNSVNSYTAPRSVKLTASYDYKF
jgi:hypothetical protein